MAKANIRKAGGARTRIVGPTLFTERLRPPAWDGDVPTIYVEAWRLRSDGMIQSRIVRTRPAESYEGHATEHSSGYTNLAHQRPHLPVDRDLVPLRSFLARKGCTIIKEQGY